jgi:hypothetical protein
MGTDIHAHVEVKLHGRWLHFGAPHVVRDYDRRSCDSVLWRSEGMSTISHVPPCDAAAECSRCDIARESALLGVVKAARQLRVSHTTTCDDRPVCVCGLNDLRDALARLDASRPR